MPGAGSSSANNHQISDNRNKSTKVKQPKSGINTQQNKSRSNRAGMNNNYHKHSSAPWIAKFDANGNVEFAQR